MDIHSRLLGGYFDFVALTVSFFFSFLNLSPLCFLLFPPARPYWLFEPFVEIEAVGCARPSHVVTLAAGLPFYHDL